ncbi:MAG: hypothetical protein P8Y92_18775 [Halioglobus sp.]
MVAQKREESLQDTAIAITALTSGKPLTQAPENKVFLNASYSW